MPGRDKKHGSSVNPTIRQIVIRASLRKAECAIIALLCGKDTLAAQCLSSFRFAHFAQMCEYRRANMSFGIVSPLHSASAMTTSNPITHPESAGARAGKNDGAEGNPNFVLSLSRGLKVIEAFEGHTQGLSVADVSRQTGLSRAAVRRLLMTLEMLGYAESSGRAYRLKTRVLKLGFSYLSSTSLPAIAQPILEQTSELLHESSSLSVLDGDEIVYVARSAPKRVM